MGAPRSAIQRNTENVSSGLFWLVLAVGGGKYDPNELIEQPIAYPGRPSGQGPLILALEFFLDSQQTIKILPSKFRKDFELLSLSLKKLPQIYQDFEIRLDPLCQEIRPFLWVNYGMDAPQ